MLVLFDPLRYRWQLRETWINSDTQSCLTLKALHLSALSFFSRATCCANLSSVDATRSLWQAILSSSYRRNKGSVILESTRWIITHTSRDKGVKISLLQWLPRMRIPHPRCHSADQYIPILVWEDPPKAKIQYIFIHFRKNVPIQYMKHILFGECHIRPQWHCTVGPVNISTQKVRNSKWESSERIWSNWCLM